MTKILIEHGVQQPLGGSQSALEIRNQSGELPAYLIPVEVDLDHLDYEKLGDLFSDDEIERARRSQNDCSTEELLARLRQL